LTKWNNQLYWTDLSGADYFKQQLWTIEELGWSSGIFSVSNNGEYISQVGDAWPSWGYITLSPTASTSA